MKDVYTYQIGNNLYINLTNSCTNRCMFCVRDQSAEYEGYKLWIHNEPTAEDILSELSDVKKYDEIVFCGYGEPTCRFEVMKQICANVRQKGVKIRLNTNGHGNYIQKRDITPELKNMVDAVNISLNAPDENSYENICRPQIKNAFSELISFAICAKKTGLNVWFSVVDCIGENAIAHCKKIAEEVGIPLRVRKMIHNDM